MGGLRRFGLAASLAAGLAGCASNSELERRLDNITTENKRLQSYVNTLNGRLNHLANESHFERQSEIQYARKSSVTLFKHYVKKGDFSGQEVDLRANFSGLCVGKNESTGDMYFLTCSHALESPERVKYDKENSKLLADEVYLTRHVKESLKEGTAKITAETVYWMNPHRLDLALLKCNDKKLADEINVCKKITGLDSIIEGSDIFFIGTYFDGPMTVDERMDLDSGDVEKISKFFHPASVRKGIVSQIVINEPIDRTKFLLCDMVVSPGNSGGAGYVFDEFNELSLATIIVDRGLEGDVATGYSRGMSPAALYVFFSLEEVKNALANCTESIDLSNMGHVRKIEPVLFETEP